MSQTTGIEWTDSTWNPVTGCSRLTAGCDNCYAAALAVRLLSSVYTARDPVVHRAGADMDPFAVRLWPERLADPASWMKPRRVFVNSMSDLFHADIPDAFVRQVFQVMLKETRHVYQVLTKRPARALRFFDRNRDLLLNGALPDHVWIGTSIESQDVMYRLRQLQSVPAAVRFLSCEPLLGPLQLDLRDIHWVIVGGESGLGHRSMDLDWVRSIRQQCIVADVAFFFKQIGGRTPKARGRLLDGRTWDEMPLQPA